MLVINQNLSKDTNLLKFIVPFLSLWKLTLWRLSPSQLPSETFWLNRWIDKLKKCIVGIKTTKQFRTISTQVFPNSTNGNFKRLSVGINGYSQKWQPDGQMEFNYRDYRNIILCDTWQLISEFFEWLSDSLLCDFCFLCVILADCVL